MAPRQPDHRAATESEDVMGLLEWTFGERTKMGVYAIVNLVEGKQYVGSSKDLRRRWRDHWNELQSNKHSNAHLQRAFNKYGEAAFEFRILQEVVSEEELIPSTAYRKSLMGSHHQWSSGVGPFERLGRLVEVVDKRQDTRAQILNRREVAAFEHPPHQNAEPHLDASDRSETSSG